MKILLHEAQKNQAFFADFSAESLKNSLDGLTSTELTLLNELVCKVNAHYRYRNYFGESQERLGLKLGLSRGHTNRLLKSLSDKGFLIKYQPSRRDTTRVKKGYQLCRYQLHPLLTGNERVQFSVWLPATHFYQLSLLSSYLHRLQKKAFPGNVTQNKEKDFIYNPSYGKRGGELLKITSQERKMLPITPQQMSILMRYPERDLNYARWCLEKRSDVKNPFKWLFATLERRKKSQQKGSIMALNKQKTSQFFYDEKSHSFVEVKKSPPTPPSFKEQPTKEQLREMTAGMNYFERAAFMKKLQVQLTHRSPNYRKKN